MPDLDCWVTSIGDRRRHPACPIAAGLTLFRRCQRRPSVWRHCPPAFRASHHLSDWPDCRLELHCCRGQTIVPVDLLMHDHGDPTCATVLARLRCQRCKAAPAPVYLCAGGREHAGGAAPDWAIELVPMRQR